MTLARAMISRSSRRGAWRTRSGGHTNDYVTSFYSHSPSGFFVEYGWGGCVIEPGIWQPHETHDGPSLWGHERLYMEPEQRARLREMRLSASARGVRAPVRIPDCPWLDAVIARDCSTGQ